MTPTIERAYGSEDSKTDRAQKAFSSSRWEIATRVTKSGAGADTGQGKTEDRKQSRKLAEESNQS
jgi:hypothetical protein